MVSQKAKHYLFWAEEVTKNSKWFTFCTKLYKLGRFGQSIQVCPARECAAAALGPRPPPLRCCHRWCARVAPLSAASSPRSPRPEPYRLASRTPPVAAVTSASRSTLAPRRPATARAVRLVEQPGEEQASAPARWTSGTRQPPAPPPRARARTFPRLTSPSAFDAAGTTWLVPHALPALRSQFDSLSFTFTSHE